MKVLLVNPKYPETFWSFRHVLKFIAKKAAFPPLGLLTVAAMLPGSWEKRLVDMNVRELADNDLAWADMVMIGAMLVQKDSAREVISRARAAGARVVAGGPAFTSSPGLFPGVDHLVLNEAEVTLPLFLRDLATGRPKPVYASGERPDIAATPAPLWSLIDFRDYASMALQYSRGCPFNCEFCDIVVMNGRVPRTKTTSQMLAELDGLHEAGWRGSVFIVDDNFIGNTARVKRFLPELIAWQKARRFPFMFFTEASLNLAQDEELMCLMSAANFHKVFLGIESPSLESLKECGKHQNTVLDMAQAVDVIHGHGMQVMAGFIVGFDSDTEGIFEAQRNFIQKVGVVTAMVGMLSAVPGTRLWHRLKAENRLLGEATGENTDGTINFIPRMGAEALVSGYRELMQTLYTPKLYYRRIHRFLKSYRPTVHTRMTPIEMWAFVRSMWAIGLRRGSMRHYWGLLGRTLLTRCRSLPMAVELAIYGLHFEKCARRAAGR